MSEDSTTEISQEEALARLAFLTRDYLPQAEWTVGGVFRFDRGVQTIANFLGTQLGVRTMAHVAGAPPCLWTLDYFAQRRPIALDAYVNALETYARMGIGVILVFDNPYLDDAAIEDPYGAMLVTELYNRDRIRKNAVCVANDKLAAKIRTLCKLPVHCHYNRLVAELNRRTPALYNKLAEQYDRVALHPADAAKPAVVSALTAPKKFDIVVNDPTLRNSAVRRDMLKLVADMRRAPYDTSLMARRASLLDRDGEQKVQSALSGTKSSCNLTRQELQQLYAAGFRRFVVQSQHFRNEMTLLWDIMQCMLDYSPELCNKAALIASSAMAEFGKPSTELPSGLRPFSFSNYE